MKARIIDKDGDFSEYTTNVVVTNAAPSVTPAANQTSNEGALHSFDLGSFSDAGAGDGPWHVSVDWGDGSSATTFDTSSQGLLGTRNHTYADGPNTWTVTVTVTDGDGSSGSATFDVDVNNVAPSVTLNGPNPVDEGTTHTYSFTVTDPGQDAFTVDAGPTCGGGGTYVAGSLSTNPGGGSFQCSFPDGPATTTCSSR